MNDLIERQAAVDAVNRVNESHMNLKGAPMLGWCTLLDEIESLPSAEPRKGKWVRRIVGTDYWHCSECGDYGLHTDFCPMCGADMRGEEE